MNIKTRHGYEKPVESDLEDYQLGWSIDEGCLYIKDPSQEGEKVLRVLSDKALLDANQKFIAELRKSLNDYSDAEIAKAKEDLKKLYEKKTTYVIEFGLPAEADREEGVDYTVDTEFDYYTKETADEAVASFIEKLNSSNIGNQDPDIKNAGSKIIISKADHSVAYLYMILEDNDGKEYGQLINTLEQSFPSLVLEWSDKKENTIEFKLNDEVLNEINFSNMVVDEGAWSHGEGVRLTASLDNEYIEYVSPICFRAKKDCYIRPNQYIEYDDDYAYGYRYSSDGLEDFKSHGTIPKDKRENNIFGNTKISKKISENDKRNKYYSIFRIKENSTVTSSTWSKNGYSTTNGAFSGNVTFTSINNPLLSEISSETASSAFYSFSYQYPVEVYDNQINQWVYTSKSSKLPCHRITPTADMPIILNYYSQDTVLNTESNSSDTKNIASSFLYLDYKGFDKAVNFVKSGNFNNSTALKDITSSNPFYNQTIEFTKRAHADTKSKMFSSYLKIKSDDFIKIEKGFKYVILEALDINSRAYILPIYTDTKRTKVRNQLIDIEQIIYSNPFPYGFFPCEYVSGNSIASLVKYNTDTSKRSTDIFDFDSKYEFGETVTNQAYIAFSDLVDSKTINLNGANSKSYLFPHAPYFGANYSSNNAIKGLACSAGLISGFAPNYKYINVKGLDE